MWPLGGAPGGSHGPQVSYAHFAVYCSLLVKTVVLVAPPVCLFLCSFVLCFKSFQL